MTFEPQVVLTLLQHGDSQFPSGAFAFSAGLEGLLADHRTRPADLPELLRLWLRCRWASFDRVFLRKAWRAAVAADSLATLDQELDAMLLAPAERAGSVRAGAALLAAHRRLGTSGAEPLAKAIAAGELTGHRLILDGAVWRAIGLNEDAAALLSVYGYISALGTAAIRLGASSALAQQRLMTELAPDMARLASMPLGDEETPVAFSPWAEIALLRQPLREQMLFAT